MPVTVHKRVVEAIEKEEIFVMDLYSPAADGRIYKAIRFRIALIRALYLFNPQRHPAKYIVTGILKALFSVKSFRVDIFMLPANPVLSPSLLHVVKFLLQAHF